MLDDEATLVFLGEDLERAAGGVYFTAYSSTVEDKDSRSLVVGECAEPGLVAGAGEAYGCVSGIEIDVGERVEDEPLVREGVGGPVCPGCAQCGGALHQLTHGGPCRGVFGAGVMLEECWEQGVGGSEGRAAEEQQARVEPESGDGREGIHGACSRESCCCSS